MALSSSINLSDVDKLKALRKLDQFRPWHSLDEKRFCLVCGKIITGEQIQVIGGMRGTGPLRIICPTPDCHSIPMDWVLPTDEVLIQISASSTSSRELPTAKSRDDNGQNVISSWAGKPAASLRHPGLGGYSGHECSAPSGRSIIGDQT